MFSTRCKSFIKIAAGLKNNAFEIYSLPVFSESFFSINILLLNRQNEIQSYFLKTNLKTI
jgi:hypothetical protein